MMKARHIILASAAVLSAIGCTKTHQETYNPGASEIMLSAKEAAETKAMLDKSTFATAGNRLKIYDYVDDSTAPYIDDYIGPDVDGNTYGYDGVWPFVGGAHQWTPGVHRFFGWLAEDAGMSSSNTPESFFGSGFEFDETSRTLSIPSLQMTVGSPQFDFMYSNIVSTEPQQTPVNLEFSHLFTAVSFGVENSTSSFVRIDDFKIERIPNTRSASIDFSGSTTVVDYSELTNASPTFNRSLDSGKYPYEISPKGLRSNIFNGSTTQEFMMLWPVDAEFLYSAEKSTISDGGEVLYPEEWKMYIKYTAEGQTYEKRINFPNIDWKAGKRYHFNIVFADKMVELRTEVKPWEYEEQSIDYTNEGVSISSGGVLSWNGTVSDVNTDKQMVSIVNAQPAQAQFSLQTPLGGSWIVSLVGDVNAFEVTPSTGVISGQTETIYIKPLVASPTRDYKVQLKFNVRRSDGRMIAADNIIQGNGIYTVVLPRNN